MEIGTVIHEEMKKQGISQNELARLAQISQSGLCSIINGKVSPRLDTLTAISTILNISIGYLVGENTEKSEPMPAQNKELFGISEQLNRDGIAELVRFGKYLAQDPRYQKDESTEQAI